MAQITIRYTHANGSTGTSSMSIPDGSAYTVEINGEQVHGGKVGEQAQATPAPSPFRQDGQRVYGSQINAGRDMTVVQQTIQSGGINMANARIGGEVKISNVTAGRDVTVVSQTVRGNGVAQAGGNSQASVVISGNSRVSGVVMGSHDGNIVIDRNGIKIEVDD